LWSGPPHRARRARESFQASNLSDNRGECDRLDEPSENIPQLDRMQYVPEIERQSEVRAEEHE
jgi:hypothetical protein